MRIRRASGRATGKHAIDAAIAIARALDEFIALAITQMAVFVRPLMALFLRSANCGFTA